MESAFGSYNCPLCKISDSPSIQLFGNSIFRNFSSKAFTHDVFICFLKVFVNTLYLNYNLTLCVNSRLANADCFIKSKCFCILFYTQFSNARPCLFNFFFLPTLEKEILFVVFAGIKKCVCALTGFYFTFFYAGTHGFNFLFFFIAKKEQKNQGDNQTYSFSISVEYFLISKYYVK